MNDTQNDGQSLRSIVVGIDGSPAAMNAALWAIDEAVSREIPLRLVHVIHPEPGAAKLVAVTDDPLEVEYGEADLRIAAGVVTATGKPVKVETALLRGAAGAALIAESRDRDRPRGRARGRTPRRAAGPPRPGSRRVLGPGCRLAAT